MLDSIVRSIPGKTKCLYLTFDDGPDLITTPLVLDCLARHDAKATFFIIAEKAERQPELVKRTVSEGHATGNHSLDHRYRSFFTNQTRLRNWIEESENIIRQKSGVESVGFRPPLGFRTAKLKRVLKEMNQPLILWAIRYYDAVLPWTKSNALRSLSRAQNGDIILLHDRQRPRNMNSFLQTLDAFLKAGTEHGFRFEALRRTDCSRG